MKAQVAFEYITIVGLVLLFLIPLWAYVTNIKTKTIEQISLTYAENAASRLASAADLVYSQGSPAKITQTVYIPGGVTSSRIVNTTIIFSVTVGSSYSDVVAVSIAPINGTLPSSEGNYQISVESFGSYVNMTVL